MKNIDYFKLACDITRNHAKSLGIEIGQSNPNDLPIDFKPETQEVLEIKKSKPEYAK